MMDEIYGRGNHPSFWVVKHEGINIFYILLWLSFDTIILSPLYELNVN